MAESKTWSLWLVIVLVSPFYGEKVNKKSAIVAQHHKDKCEDFGAVSKKCHMWKDLGFCFKHRKEMQFVCSKTCKFCDPGQSHWTYTVTPDTKADTKTTIPSLNKLSPTMEVVGKKKALYLSSKDIAGMLQTLSSKDYGPEKPTSKPKELAVIQGRIQNIDLSGTKVNATKAPPKESEIKPQANVGGKVQIPPVKNDGEKEKPTQGNKEHGDKPEKPQEKLTVTGNKEIDSTLLNLMNNLMHGTEGKEKKLDDKDKKPEPSVPTNLQITVPDLLKALEKVNGKTITSYDKENRTKEQASSNAKEQHTEEAVGNKEPEVDPKTKALLAAMKLVKTVGPLPAEAMNNSNIMDQLKVAAEEASVAMKLLNKTEEAKGNNTTMPVADAHTIYNVQLLQEELNKHLNNGIDAAGSVTKVESAKNAAPNDTSITNPQLGKFIVSLQDAINAQQNQPSAATSITGRGGVATKSDEGKPTLTEVIPFDIRIDSDDDDDSKKKEDLTESKGAKKDKQQSIYESDEQKILKILNGLDQNDSTKKSKKEDDGSKGIMKDIRTAYDDLGEIINGVEQDEGITKTKKKEEGSEEEEQEGDSNERKKKKDKDDKQEKKDKKKDKDDKDDESGKKKKKKIDNDDDDDDDDANDEYSPFDEEPKRKKKKKPLSKKDHLLKVLSYIKKADKHLEKIGGKRVKIKKQKSEEEDADTRTAKDKEGTNWKVLATKLARQLGLVLKRMAEKDQKLMAERNRLQGVLATLARIESQRDEGQTGTTDVRGEDDDDDDGEEDSDEDRSQIIHSMATKLLNFSKTINEAQKSNRLRTPRRKKKVLHNLVSRYRNLVHRILDNWIKLKNKGKKKSKIPKKGEKSAKRGEIIRNKGNSTTDTIQNKKKSTKTAKIMKSTEKNEKNAKKKNGIPDEKPKNTQSQTETVTDGEQDVLEVANR